MSRNLIEPLGGLRVIDFTIVMSGPYCTRILADAGADVIKVEPPEGDMVRQRPPFKSGIGTYFASMNCGKRSVVLDLKTQEGLETARALAATADVVVENFRPGVMDRLGLGYEQISLENPAVIYCSISGYGQTGPMSKSPAYAPVIHAATGYDDAHARYQDDPRPPNNAIFVADVLGAVHAATAIQMALFARQKSGKGQHVDVALMDAVLGMLIGELQQAQFPSSRPRHLYKPIKASDGYVMVAAISPRNMRALFETIGREDVLADPKFQDLGNRELYWDQLLEMAEEWTSVRTSDECVATLSASGVPCSKYRTVKEAMTDEQAIHRKLMKQLGSGDDSFLVANPPYRFTDAKVEARDRIPILGAHTDEVLREVLSWDQQRIEAMRDTGAFGALL